MEKVIFNSKEKAFSTLEDIVDICGPQTTGLVGQAKYYFDKAQDQTFDLSQFKALDSFLNNSFKELIHHYFLNKSHAKQVNIHSKSSQIKVNTWNKLIDSLPIVLEVISCFKFESTFNVNLSDEGIDFNFVMKNDDLSEDSRTKVYSLYRKLFQRQCLLTYSIEEEELDTSNCQVTLKLDLSDNCENAYGFDVLADENIFVGLPCCFARYVVKNEKFESRGPCLEITEDLELISHRKFPKTYWRQNEDKELISFPFLFRPLSIIIPKKGKLIPYKNVGTEGNTGSAIPSSSKDTYLSKMQVHFLDFFSYFQK